MSEPANAAVQARKEFFRGYAAAIEDACALAEADEVAERARGEAQRPPRQMMVLSECQAFTQRSAHIMSCTASVCACIFACLEYCVIR